MGLAGTGATGWGYVGETSSQRLRVHTAGFAAAMSAGFGVITNVAVPYLISKDAANLGLKTGWVSPPHRSLGSSGLTRSQVFAGVGAPFVVASWFIMPETARSVFTQLRSLPPMT